MISMDSWSSVRLQSRQIYCHGCSEFEFYLIVYSNCCRHLFKLAASKYEFLDSCIRVSGQKLVSRPIQETRNSFFPHLYHLYKAIPYRWPKIRVSKNIKPPFLFLETRILFFLRTNLIGHRLQIRVFFEFSKKYHPKHRWLKVCLLLHRRRIQLCTSL